MSPPADFQAHPAAVTAHLERVHARAAMGWPRVFAREWARGLLFWGAFVFLAQPLLSVGRLTAPDPSHPEFALQVGLVVLLAAVFAIMATATARKAMRSSPAEFVQSLRKTHHGIAGPGWFGRTFATGLLMGALIGAFAFVLTTSLLPTPEARDAADVRGEVVGLLGYAIAWTIPGAFLVRWVLLRQIRRFTRPPEGGA